jgi:flagellar biosynthesis protein FlhA
MSEQSYRRYGEHLAQSTLAHQITLEVGRGLLPAVERRGGGSLFEHARGIRKYIFDSLGVLIPAISIRDSGALPPAGYAVRIRDTEVARGEVLLDHWLAVGRPGMLKTLKGKPASDPSRRLTATWITAEEKEKAVGGDVLLFDDMGSIASHMAEVLKRNAYRFLGYEEIDALLAEVRKERSILIDEMVLPYIPIQDLRRILVDLVKDGIPIRDLLSILETVADNTGYYPNVEVISEAVRESLSIAICRSYADERGRIGAIVLNGTLEELLADSLDFSTEYTLLNITSGVMRSLKIQILEGKRRLEGQGLVPILVCPRYVRPVLLRTWGEELEGMVILSRREIAPGFKVLPLYTVGAAYPMMAMVKDVATALYHRIVPGKAKALAALEELDLHQRVAVAVQTLRSDLLESIMKDLEPGETAAMTQCIEKLSPVNAETRRACIEQFLMLCGIELTPDADPEAALEHIASAKRDLILRHLRCIFAANPQKYDPCAVSNLGFAPAHTPGAPDSEKLTPDAAAAMVISQNSPGWFRDRVLDLLTAEEKSLIGKGLGRVKSLKEEEKNALWQRICEIFTGDWMEERDLAELVKGLLRDGWSLKSCHTWSHRAAILLLALPDDLYHLIFQKVSAALPPHSASELIGRLAQHVHWLSGDIIRPVYFDFVDFCSAKGDGMPLRVPHEYCRAILDEDVRTNPQRFSDVLLELVDEERLVAGYTQAFRSEPDRLTRLLLDFAFNGATDEGPDPLYTVERILDQIPPAWATKMRERLAEKGVEIGKSDSPEPLCEEEEGVILRYMAIMRSLDARNVRSRIVRPN